jgi:hypothetical protein
MICLVILVVSCSSAAFHSKLSTILLNSPVSPSEPYIVVGDDDRSTTIGSSGLDIAPGRIIASGGVIFRMTSGIGESRSDVPSFSFHLLRSRSMTRSILRSNLRFLNFSHWVAVDHR